MDFNDNKSLDSTVQEKIPENPQYFDFSKITPQVTPVVKEKVQTNAEFVLGAILLGSVGGAFILAAVIMLGMNFMNNLCRGICAYAVGLLLWVIFELVLCRRQPKVGKIFSVITMAGIYGVTIWNCLLLKNFGMWVAVSIVLVTTLISIVLSRKRASLLYSVIGIVTWHVSIFLMQTGLTQTDAIILTIIIFVVNLLYIFIPNVKQRTGFYIVQMLSNAAYIWGTLMLTTALMGIGEYGMLFSGIIIMQTAYTVGIFYCRKELKAGRKSNKEGLTVSYVVGNLICLQAMNFDIEMHKWLQHGLILGLLVIYGLTMFILWKGKEKWVPYYLIIAYIFFTYATFEKESVAIIGTFICLLISKLFTWWNSSQLKLYDAIVTTLYCLFAITIADKEASLYIMLVILGAIIGILLMKECQTYLEIVFVFMLSVIAIIKLPPILELQVVVGILYVSLLLFNHLKRWQGKHIVIFNVFALVGEVICFLILMLPIYQSAYIVYFCMLVFGLATIILVFSEEETDFHVKNLILAIFLSYMAFILKTNQPIINSVLLMVIALFSVGVGFGIKEKKIRIYGLVLSLLVCGKIVLYDDIGASIIQKMLLLLVIGIIALIISGIYIVLEIKNKNVIK